MKTNKLFMAGILAIALVFGMTVVGCDDESTDNGGNSNGNGNGNGNGDVPPEERPVADRWYKWVDPSSSATLDYSVADDGLCTITVGGNPDSADEKWKANARYNYTGSKYLTYVYVFEAWTQGDARSITVQYYGGGGGDVAGPPYLSRSFSITSERKTYAFVGTNIPESGVSPLEFQCANQMGTFYVKIISVTRTNVLDTINIKSITPFEGLTDGTKQQFTIEVDYVLSTFEQGVISCSFNNGDIENSFDNDIGVNTADGYVRRDDAGNYVPVENDRLVSKGNGSRTFTVTALTKNWGSEGAFRVGVSLIPKTNDLSLYPLAYSQYKTLSFSTGSGPGNGSVTRAWSAGTKLDWIK